MDLLLNTLLAQLKQFPPARHYRVAYSGGCDSHVLLHALVAIQDQFPATTISALHVNHGLAEEADRWAAHCEQVAAGLGVAFQAVPVDGLGEAGESPEAAARQARYHVFAQQMAEGDGLLLAHHEDDQAETLLLQLFRGAGVRGLAAMPEHAVFAKGWLGRPLLGLSRQHLRDYAKAAGLNWIEDPGNQSPDFDRNFLRHDIIPDLLPRWPALTRTLARAARHQSAASRLLDEQAAADLQAAQGSRTGCLSMGVLNTLSRERQDNLLRYWIRQQGGSMPSSVQLQRVRNEVVSAREDAQPQVGWADSMVRRYRDDLYLVSAKSDQNKGEFLSWDLKMERYLADGRCLKLERRPGAGLKASLQGRTDVSVRFRKGGEVCRPLGRKQTHRLKTLWQEWRVPPWQRHKIPLIYVGEEIAQVVGYCICEPWQANADEAGLIITEQV
ncbi:tRNA(Ile)-lysidine synthetase [hydrothermal vent metagenome]|uniref:tRNA(Ile)-lysidine synthetase n=1 Tax=hydrothermal vent metagenome TaxID=652676 RepID=A0A3B1BMX7_9ZZZZ